MSPTALSLRKLREDGWTCQVVEHWNHFAKIRQDLFHCIDIVALRGETTLGIQATTASNKSARIHKIDRMPEARNWLAARNKLEVWSWKKKNGRWVVDIHEIKNLTVLPLELN